MPPPQSVFLSLQLSLHTPSTPVCVCVSSLSLSLSLSLGVSLPGVRGGASLHAVLCYEAADGEGPHRRHHRGGTLLAERGQAHQTADRLQDTGTIEDTYHNVIDSKTIPCPQDLMCVSDPDVRVRP